MILLFACLFYLFFLLSFLFVLFLFVCLYVCLFVCLISFFVCLFLFCSVLFLHHMIYESWTPWINVLINRKGTRHSLFPERIYIWPTFLYEHPRFIMTVHELHCIIQSVFSYSPAAIKNWLKRVFYKPQGKTTTKKRIELEEKHDLDSDCIILSWADKACLLWNGCSG